MRSTHDELRTMWSIFSSGEAALEIYGRGYSPYAREFRSVRTHVQLGAVQVCVEPDRVDFDAQERHGSHADADELVRGQRLLRGNLERVRERDARRRVDCVDYV